MKILLVCEHKQGTDGWSRYARDHRKELTSHGHDVRVCCRKEQEGDYPVLSRPLDYLTRPHLSLIAALHIRRISKTFRPDIIHFVVEPYALCSSFLPKKILSRTILTIHGSYGIRPLLYSTSRLLSLVAYKRIPQFITVSHYTKNAVTQKLHSLEKDRLAAFFKEHAHVIHNGIGLPSWKTRAKPRDGTKNILHVGGVKPLKGVREAIEACAMYREKYGTPFLFSIIGNIPENDRYVAQVNCTITKHHLIEFVHLRGLLSEQALRDAYESADLLLMPALTQDHTFEGFGLVYLEANAYGVPCIGPRTSGAAEAIEEGKSGYKIDSGNPKEIAERMHWILDEKNIKPESCRAWAEEHSIEKTVGEVEEIYRRVLPICK